MTKIAAISDTHSYHRRLTIPDGDILIHAGDISWRGELDIISDFCMWLKELPHKNKIVICGNHELGIEAGFKRQSALDMIRDSGAIYLEDSGVEIAGIKIYGSPVTPVYGNWEWNRERGKDIRLHWDKIPDDTNLLITHGPPYGILDFVDYKQEHIGCRDLLNRIENLKELKAVVFGHKHRDFNEQPVVINNTIFVNASILNNRSVVANDPIVIEI